MRMEDVEIQARQLYDALGSKAIATAARRAASFEEAGQADEARNWRRIEYRLKEHRGPRES